jgi:hypothetical protein
LAALLLAANRSGLAELALVEEVTGPGGCAPRLLGSEEHKFIEAQIACDAFSGLAIVSEALDGKTETAAAVAAVRRLLADAKGRAREGVREVAAQHLRRGYQLLLYTGLARLGGLTEERPAPTTRWRARSPPT